MKIFNIFVLFISIFTLNNSIVSMEDVSIERKSSSASSSEHLVRPLNMAQLVDLVSDRLADESLTFNSPVPHEMYDVFMNGMEKVRNTIPDHESELRIITEKARTLLESGELTSKWLMHLSLCTAAVLSPADDMQNFHLTLGGSTIEEGFERFTCLHDNAGSLRDNFSEFRSKGPIGKEIDFGRFSLTFDSSSKINWVFDYCFWMPWIGKKPFFKANTFNKAYANRIAIVGIPLQDCGYDGFLTAPPLSVAIHDMGHADDYFSYRRNPERIFFDTPNDTRDILVAFARTLWNAAEMGQEKGRIKDSINDYILFLILHENISDGLPEDIYTATTPLNEFIETVLENAQKSLEENAKISYSTAQLYWRTQLEADGVKNIKVIRPETIEECRIFFKYEMSFDDFESFSGTRIERTRAIYYSTEEDPEFKRFSKSSAYENEKLELERSVKFINHLGFTDITVDNYYAFLLSKFADFKSLFNSASSAAHP